MRCFCTFESRPTSLVGLKLLALSFQRHCPDETLLFHLPADLIGSFRAWSANRLPPDTFRIVEFQPKLGHWNIKPEILLRLLEEGWPEVVWIDADILVVNKLATILDGLNDETLLVADEPLEPRPCDQFSFWPDLTQARYFKVALNTCLVRVTRHHRTLLEEWHQHLQDSRYARETQKESMLDMHKGASSDQAVLDVLLCSTLHDFDQIPVRRLRQGTEVLQAFFASTYTPWQRLRNALTGARHLAILHCQGPKAWEVENRRWYRYHRKLDPYNAEARRYRDALAGEELAWLLHDGPAVTLFKIFGLYNRHLQGLPHQLLHAILRKTRLRPHLSMGKPTPLSPHIRAE